MEFFGGPIRPPFDRDDIDVYGDYYVFEVWLDDPNATTTVKIPMPKLDREGKLKTGPLKGYAPDPFFDRNVWEYQELMENPDAELVRVERDRLIKIPENSIVVYTVTNSGYAGHGGWQDYSQQIYGRLGQSHDDAIRGLGLDPNNSGFYYGVKGGTWEDANERFSVAETSIPIADIPSNARFIQPSQR